MYTQTYESRSSHTCHVYEAVTTESQFPEQKVNLSGNVAYDSVQVKALK